MNADYGTNETSTAAPAAAPSQSEPAPASSGDSPHSSRNLKLRDELLLSLSVDLIPSYPSNLEYARPAHNSESRIVSIDYDSEGPHHHARAPEPIRYTQPVFPGEETSYHPPAQEENEHSGMQEDNAGGERRAVMDAAQP
jgi:hypothetical protein